MCSNAAMASRASLTARLRRGLTLTPEEKLRVYRRQKECTQREMADLFGVTEDRYRRWEDGVGKVPAVKVTLGQLTLGDLCALHRRRLGISLRELAAALGMSTTWTFNASNGRAGADRVVDYLEKQRAKS